MGRVVGIVFLIFCVYHIGASILKNSIQQDNEDELVSVAVLYRHGDATPSKASSFPNDPYIDAFYWPMGYGQLTPKGKDRMHDLGLWLRNRYNTFLPMQFNVKDVYVRSTDLDITLMSAEVNLDGLYPPTPSDTGNTYVPQPVPIHTIPLDDDQYLYMGSDCPKFYEIYDEIYDNAFFSEVNNENADFYRQLSLVSGWNITDISTVSQLHAILNIYANYDESFLPPWAPSLDQERLSYLAALDYVRYTSTEGLKRLGAGPFFSYLFSHFENVVNNPADARKLLMLVGHESTLVATLNTMGVFDNQISQFGSVVIWELRKSSSGEYSIKLFYENAKTQQLNELIVKSYEDYRNDLEPYTVDIDTWYQECAAN